MRMTVRTICIMLAAILLLATFSGCKKQNDTAENLFRQFASSSGDYRAKLAHAQRPWLISVITLLLCVIILLFIIFKKTRHKEKLLKKLVDERTSELEVQASNFKTMFNSIPDTVFCKDVNLLFTRANKSMETQFARQRTDIIGKNEVEGLGLPIEIARQHEELEKKVIKDGLIVKFVEAVPVASGKITIFETIKVPLMSNGKITGLLAIARDITKHKAAEEDARNANRAKSEFLTTMSHEIRTPMNAILGIAEMQMQNNTLPQDIAESFVKIYNSGDLLLNIINDILDLSKIEAGKLELTPAKYEVASLINDTVHLNMLRYESKPIEFKLQVDENVPSSLLGDELRIRQILNNIMSNAFKYTERGEIEMTIFVEKPPQEETGHVTLVFRVRDTGQGMTQEQIGKLFDEYARFNLKTNRTTQGTGLGMPITRNLVNMMGGKIDVDSTPGKGSVFTVRLPQKNAGTGVLGKELAENIQKFRFTKATQVRKAQIVRTPMPYGSVLIVDDTKTNLDVAKLILSPYGLKIETANSGLEAINKIKDGKKYDIVFMDHMMPEMDGVEAVKIMRELGYKDPIVALTANAIVGQADMFLKNGFDEYISKPIDIRQLNAILNKMIRDKYR